MIQPDPKMNGRFYYHPVQKEVINIENVESIEDVEVNGEFKKMKVYTKVEHVTKVWADVMYIEVRAQGQKNSSFSHNLSESTKLEKFKIKFPRAWAEFEGTDTGPIEGTPIKFMAGATPALILQLSELGIRSLEDVSIMDDNVCMDIREGFKLRKGAEAYLASMEAMNEPEDEIKDIPGSGDGKMNKPKPKGKKH